MSDKPKRGGQSPEAVALELVDIIADVEQKSLQGMSANKVTREWLLDTYAECLQATTGSRKPKAVRH
jgi:hypothetical protein